MRRAGHVRRDTPLADWDTRPSTSAPRRGGARRAPHGAGPTRRYLRASAAGRGSRRRAEDGDDNPVGLARSRTSPPGSARLDGQGLQPSPSPCSLPGCGSAGAGDGAVRPGRQADGPAGPARTPGVDRRSLGPRCGASRAPDPERAGYLHPPPGGDALRRRGPAGEDGPPAGLRPGRADLRPRRAERRVARPGRGPAGGHARAAARPGELGARGRARSGRHRPRGPRHRDRPGAGPAWRHARVRRPGGRLPRLRDGHGRCARRSPWPAQSSAAPVVGHVGHPRRLRQQPPRHRRRHPEGCPRRGHRRGRLGKSTSSTRSWSRAVRTPSVITCAERADQIPTPISYVGASTGAGAFSRRRRGPRRRCSPSTRPAPARDAAAPSPAGRDELSYDESTTPARTAVARRFRRGPRPRLRAAASRRPGPHGRGGARPSRARTGSSTGWTSPAFGLGYLTLASHSRACPR